jgi:hypothetical protein
MDKEYVIEIVEKNKGFFVVSAKIRWHISKNLIKF